MRHPLPFSSSQSSEATAGGPRLINAYAEPAPFAGKSGLVVRSAPGVVPFADVGAGPGRGLHVMNDVVFAASGTELFTIQSDATVGSAGSLIGTDRVTFADNGSQLLLTAGGKGWVYSGNTLTQVTDPDFPGPSVVDYLDGYMLVAEAGSGKFYASKLYDATSWNALDFATAEAAPDNIVSLKVNQRQIVLFGQTSVELWYNAGSAGFPFERIAGGTLEIGCASAYGVAAQDNSLLWLANDRTVRRLNGSSPVKISSTTVDEALRSYDVVSDCIAFPFQFRGHLCTAFQFPTQRACWVYDSATQEWHQRESYDYAGWRVCAAVEAHGRTYVQDVLTGKVGVLEPTSRTEWGEPIVDRRRFPRIYRDNKLITHFALDLVCEVGVGDVTGLGADPELRLWVSRDGGKTGRFVPSQSLGRRGEHRKLISWPRLGAGRDIVVETVFSAPVPLTMTDAQVSYQVGAI